MIEMNFTPFPNFTTERLILRQLRPEDENEIFKIHSDERIAEFLIRPLYKSIDEARKFIDKINHGISNNDSVYWGITLRNEDEIIGTICIWNISKENFRAEIGFELLPQFQGKGLMQEALTTVLDYGFEKMKLHTIAGQVSPDNLSSIKIMSKNNFKREAYFKEDTFYNGKFLDTTIYTLINPNNFKDNPSSKV